MSGEKRYNVDNRMQNIEDEVLQAKSELVVEWHDQTRDMRLLQSLENDLGRFQQLKSEKWERVVEKVQMSNHLGSPSEDWIIPPDENIERELLEKDPDYIKLRTAIQTEVSLAKRCAQFLEYNTHYRLDWIKFEDPLIGNDALEDGLSEVKELQERCQTAWYFAQNMKQRFGALLRPLSGLFKSNGG